MHSDFKDTAVEWFLKRCLGYEGCRAHQARGRGMAARGLVEIRQHHCKASTWAHPRTPHHCARAAQGLHACAASRLQARRTSSKNTSAMWRYSGDLNAKSTSKSSQQLPGTGPAWKRQVESRWSNSVLSYTCDTTFVGRCRCTCEVYLRPGARARHQSACRRRVGPASLSPRGTAWVVTRHACAHMMSTSSAARAARHNQRISLLAVTEPHALLPIAWAAQDINSSTW